MFVISKDSPAYYITSVTNSRLPVFQTSKLKDLVCSAIGEVRKSANILLFAYVIMPDHFHLLIGTAREPSEALRYVNGITSRRIIDYLKNGGFEQSLQKLRRTEAERQHKYSLIHNNPVRAGLIEGAEDYRWSSVRCWNKCPREDEPLVMDVDQIKWKSRKA